jgi:tellurite resistance protein
VEGSAAVATIAPVLFVGANLLVAGVAVGTLYLLARGRLLPPMEQAAPVSR